MSLEPTSPDPEALAQVSVALAAARAEAEQSGGMVCATVAPSGRPIPFVMPSDASDQEIAIKAFQLRYQRQMNPTERYMHRMAVDRAFPKDTVVEV